VFSDDTAGWGGAIYAKQGGSIVGAWFEDNSGGAGGAVYTYGNLSVTDTTFLGNRSRDNHGGALVVNADASLSRTVVVDNYAKFNGGGVYAYNLSVDNSFIGGNEAGDKGGAIFLPLTHGSRGSLEMAFSTVYDDTVTVNGGSGPAEIQARNIDATMSVVGNSATGDIWSISGSLDDTASVSTADDTLFDGPGSGNVVPGALGFGSLTGSVPGTLGRTPEADSLLALAAVPSPLGFAPLTNPLPSITTDQLGVSRVAPFTIGARQVIGAPPVPTPSPAPATPAGPPREVTATPGVESAAVSWASPASSGSFPVTSYQVTASPGGRSCLVSAPALSCTVTGLTPGESYTFVAKALTGAGWSSPSAPSNAVVPEGQPDAKAILITSSRDRNSPSIVRVDGTTTGLVGAEVTPHVRKPGQKGFTPGSNVRTVDADGRFTWQRKSAKKLYVYFTSGDVRSNRLVIGPS
jgi:Fibronectin type III domain